MLLHLSSMQSVWQYWIIQTHFRQLSIIHQYYHHPLAIHPGYYLLVVNINHSTTESGENLYDSSLGVLEGICSQQPQNFCQDTIFNLFIFLKFLDFLTFKFSSFILVINYLYFLFCSHLSVSLLQDVPVSPWKITKKYKWKKGRYSFLFFPIIFNLSTLGINLVS